MSGSPTGGVYNYSDRRLTVNNRIAWSRETRCDATYFTRNMIDWNIFAYIPCCAFEVFAHSYFLNQILFLII